MIKAATCDPQGSPGQVACGLFRFTLRNLMILVAQSGRSAARVSAAARLLPVGRRSAANIGRPPRLAECSGHWARGAC